MVAYSFQSSFLPAIIERTKRQTIRLPRKRHARPGEALQFLSGPRMRPTRVGSAICERACDVRLDFEGETVTIGDAIVLATEEQLDAFAQSDGFSIIDGSAPARAGLRPWEYMRRWWAMTHPGHALFRGVLIGWGDSFQPEPPVFAVHFARRVP